ncbi:MAG TPA: transketolase [Bacteroidia bacterium]|nr:transketolase [Bacteroidia bacterium]
MPTIPELNKICSQVRRDIVRMTSAVNSGHPGGSMGCTEFFVSLYFVIMKVDPSNFTMDGKNEDLFFLSNGHISPVWYSVLAHRGFFPVNELSTFRKLNSRLQGHPTTAEHLPGVRVASGSLGQGLSVAIGAALAKKLNKDTRLVYTLHGDGEMNEGQIWEAAMYAAAHKVDNIISSIDVNGLQIDGKTDDVLSLGDLKAKWIAFGWDVMESDGNDLENVIATLKEAQKHTGKGKPVMILMKTIMGKGVDFMENHHKWHGTAPNADELAKALGLLEETHGDYK